MAVYVQVECSTKAEMGVYVQVECSTGAEVGVYAQVECSMKAEMAISAQLDGRRDRKSPFQPSSNGRRDQIIAVPELVYDTAMRSPAGRDENGSDPRRQLTPQMAVYDDAGQSWLPYLMFFQPPNLCSEVLNTDRYGFRVTWNKGRALRDLEVDADRQVDLLVGGSTVFGVGATGDQHTLPSILNETHDANDESVWLNFGGRAFFSTQELLLFLTYHGRLPKIRRVVLFSGLNNLVIFHLVSRYARDLGTIFSADAFHRAMDRVSTSELGLPAARRVLQALLHPYFGDEVDYASVSVRELAGLLFGATTPNPTPEAGGQPRDPADLLYTWERDLTNWRLLCKALDIELCYVLQPFADWIDKSLAPQEEQLFAELDRLDPDWRRVREIDLGRDRYAWYAGELRAGCAKQGVDFHDMNELLSRRQLKDRWLFVDRVHLNDDGHRLVAEVLRQEVLGQ